MSVTWYRQAIIFNRREAELIGRIDVELSVQGIIGHDRRAATIRAGLLFVTNLGSYPCQTR